MPYPNYAIELTLMLYQNGEWVSGFTYYNHGECPPFGGVKSDARGSPLVLDVEEFENNIMAIEDWKRKVINVVSSMSAIPKEGVPDTPVEYKVEYVGDEIRYKLDMASIELYATYDISDKTVTFAVRNALDVSWRGFLFHQETMLDFLTEIKGE